MGRAPNDERSEERAAKRSDFTISRFHNFTISRFHARFPLPNPSAARYASARLIRTPIPKLRWLREGSDSFPVFSYWYFYCKFEKGRLEREEEVEAKGMIPPPFPSHHPLRLHFFFSFQSPLFKFAIKIPTGRDWERVRGRLSINTSAAKLPQGTQA